MATPAVELKAQAAAVLKRMHEIQDAADAESRDFTAEEDANWNAAKAEWSSLNARADRAAYLESMPLGDLDQDTYKMRQIENNPPKSSEEAEANARHRYTMAWREYMGARNTKLVSPEAWETLYQGSRGLVLADEDKKRLQALLSPEQYKAAMSVGSQTGGGFLVPDDVMQRIEKALLWFGGMQQFGETITTDDGGDLPWPVYDDTSNTGRRLAENTTATQTDISVALRVLKAHMYTSDELLISQQLMQDRPDLASNIVADALAERIARGTNAEFTTYGGGDGPQGLITNLTTGVTAAANNAVTADELQQLKYSVNRIYRMRPGAAYMMNDASIGRILRLKDGDGEYLFTNPNSGDEPRIWGSPVIVNNDMPDMATGVTSIVYGDGSSYKIRQVRGFTLLRMDERYAPVLQVSFLGFARYDGGYINAGQNPIKALVHP